MKFNLTGLTILGDPHNKLLNGLSIRSHFPCSMTKSTAEENNPLILLANCSTLNPRMLLVVSSAWLCDGKHVQSQASPGQMPIWTRASPSL